MSTPTKTIRISTATHELLAAQARDRGITLAALLTEMAEQRRREAIWQSEREASRRDAQGVAASEELRDWEETLGDGIG